MHRFDLEYRIELQQNLEEQRRAMVLIFVFVCMQTIQVDNHTVHQLSNIEQLRIELHSLCPRHSMK